MQADRPVLYSELISFQTLNTLAGGEPTVRWHLRYHNWIWGINHAQYAKLGSLDTVLFIIKGLGFSKVPCKLHLESTGYRKSIYTVILFLRKSAVVLVL